MRIVGREKLSEFAGAHADARPWIDNWIAATELVTWRTPPDVKDQYASASFLADNVIVFNVKGNRYRLEVLIAYRTGTVVIRKIETHAEYSKRDKRTK